MTIKNEIKVMVRETALSAFEEGLMAGTSGNISYFDREEGVVYITPSNVAYRQMKPEEVVAITLEGEVLASESEICSDRELRPSSEWRLHTELYKSLDHVHSVIHTHSPYATAFAAAAEKIPLILVEMLPFLGGDIPVAEFGMPGSVEVGRAAASVMKNRNAALLKSHGVAVAGGSLQQAYLRAVYVEDAAKICHLARQLGTPVVLDQDTERELREKYHLPQEAEQKEGEHGG